MKNWNLNKALLAGGILLVLVLAFFSNPKKRAVQTWHKADKDKYGAYVLHQLGNDFQQGEIKSHFVPLYEYAAQTKLQGNVLMVSNTLEMGTEDWEVLTQHVSKGHTALLASGFLAGPVRDSLKLLTEMANDNWENIRDLALSKEHQINLQFKNLKGFPKKKIRVPAGAAFYQFDDISSDLKYPYTSLAQNDRGGDVLRSYAIGKGHIILSSTPLLLSNAFWMNDTTRAYAAGVMSLLKPADQLQHFEYYHLGRNEAQTPLRYVLSQLELRWALYLGLAGLALFFLFGSKREQRPIPVLEPPKNHSLEFIQTLGSLHYKTKNHRGLFAKRAQFFKDFVFRHYRIRLNVQSEASVAELKARSRAEAAVIDKLAKYLDLDEAAIGEAVLLNFEKELQEFYETT